MQVLVVTATLLRFFQGTLCGWNSPKISTLFYNDSILISVAGWSHDIGGHMLGDYDEELQTELATVWCF